MTRERTESVEHSGRLVDRRTALAALGSSIVAGLAGCASLAGGQSKFQQQLSTAEEATKKYEDPKKARADGFKLGGPYVPGMGWHFSHPQRIKDAAKNGISIDKPQILTYLETKDGLKLGSVEYAVPVKAVDETPDLFADENADATEKWHTHKSATHVFALPDDKQTSPKNVSFKQWLTNDNWTEFRPPNRDLSAGDRVSLNWGTPHGKKGDTSERVVDLATTHPSLHTLHAWVHTENPDGVFKPINSKYAKGGHSH